MHGWIKAGGGVLVVDRGEVQKSLVGGFEVRIGVQRADGRQLRGMLAVDQQIGLLRVEIVGVALDLDGTPVSIRPQLCSSRSMSVTSNVKAAGAADLNCPPS